MRIRHIIKPNPKKGDTRIIKKFAWLPITIGDETRWLEKVEYVEMYSHWGFSDCGKRLLTWKPINFIEE